MIPETILAVAAGGGLGAVGRYLLGMGVTAAMGPDFPYGTLAANVLGSFIMGMVAQSFTTVFDPSAPVRAFFTTGILGGFTTFSTFSLDTAALIESGRTGAALLYVVSSVTASLGGLFGGLNVVRWFAG